MKSFFVMSFAIFSINAFGQPLVSMVKKDLENTKRDLGLCEQMYNDHFQKKEFSKPLEYVPEIKPMPSDNTLQALSPQEREIKLLESELNPLKRKLESCDSQLRTQAQVNGVELPSIEHLIDMHPQYRSSNAENWQCWSGKYQPAIISISKNTGMKSFISMTSNYGFTELMEGDKKGEFLSPNYSITDQDLYFGGLLIGKFGSPKLKITTTGDTKLMTADVSYSDSSSQQTFNLSYQCKPLQIQKANGYGVDVNTGNAKKAGSNNGKAINGSKTNDTLED